MKLNYHYKLKSSHKFSFIISNKLQKNICRSPTKRKFKCLKKISLNQKNLNNFFFKIKTFLKIKQNYLALIGVEIKFID